MLFHHFNWKNLSLISGLTTWNLYFEMFPESIKAPHVVVFLRHLLQRIPGRLLIVWDGLAAHRSQRVKEYVAGLEGRIHLERLPAYAPELNPVEYVWAHLNGRWPGCGGSQRRMKTGLSGSRLEDAADESRPVLIWSL